ncbi:ankyrin [Aspergillus sclerotioniger CBS 115572]|uniref:Ankyrin n=1 Tax=Aspergillus sclerotioniger CBS 115572 TaxID=1450535 RepID=A0A317UUM1_9EURO|nr:ankyrin [Aspergillus sclerotioniger CBS 115572]PWY64778.1 ankyrin [Aspergillus sclerotioniger CBS 115572]
MMIYLNLDSVLSGRRPRNLTVQGCSFFFNNSGARYREEMAMFTLVLLAVEEWHMSKSNGQLINHLLLNYTMDGSDGYDHLLGSPLDLNHALITTNMNVYNLPFIRWLVRNGADVNFTSERQSIKDGHGTPLIAAVVNSLQDDTSIVELLVDKGADINQSATIGPYGNALIAAVETENENMVRFLLNNPGIDVNNQSMLGSGGTALIRACCIEDDRIATLILQQPKLQVNLQASVGFYGTALIAACAWNCVETVRCLLGRPDIDVNRQSSIGDFGTALIAACYYYHLDIIRLLLDHPNINVNIQSSVGHYGTALIAACDSNKSFWYNSLGDREITIDILLNTSTIDIHARIPHGKHESALSAACCSNNAGLLKKFLPRVINSLPRQEIYGWPPVEEFMKEDCVRTIVILVKSQVPLIYQIRTELCQNTGLIEYLKRKFEDSGKLSWKKAHLVNMALISDVLDINMEIPMIMKSDALRVIWKHLDNDGYSAVFTEALSSMGFYNQSAMTKK